MADRIIEGSSGFKYIRMPSGKLYSFTEAIHQAGVAETAFARAIHRAFELLPGWPDEPEREAYRDMDYESIESALESMESYIAAARERLDKERGVKSQEDRIAKLRQVTGRTPEETEAFQKKADELQARLERGVDR